MDWIKQHLVLVISSAITLILLLALGGSLFLSVKKYQKVKSEMAGNRETLIRLAGRKTLPGEANIAREREKRDILLADYNELYSLLSDGQVVPQKMGPTDFLYFRERTLHAIREALMKSHVLFPEKYTFGFGGDYEKGVPPASTNIPRLTLQLKMTQQLCHIMAQAAVNEVVLFSREEFESAAAAVAPVQPGQEQEEEGAIYASQHFKMEFKARESSLLDFLNRLAASPMFTVVTFLDISNPKKEVNLGTARLQTPKETPKIPGAAKLEDSREKRIIFGREEVSFKLECDVYNFIPPANMENSLQKK
jgi:hypothetical protein